MADETGPRLGVGSGRGREDAIGDQGMDMQRESQVAAEARSAPQ